MTTIKLKPKTQQWVYRIGKSAVWEITPFYATKDQMKDWVEHFNTGKKQENTVSEYAKVKRSRETFKAIVA